MKSWKCLKCENRQYENKEYDRPTQIPCVKQELESRDLQACPHFVEYIKMRKRNSCPNCGSRRKKRKEGEMVCLECGTVLDRTLGPSTGTSSQPAFPTYGHTGGYSSRSSGDYLSPTSGDWPWMQSPLLEKIQKYREMSIKKGDNYCNPARNLYMCNRCDFLGHSEDEVKAHLEEEHEYELHPERRPQPEPPLLDHIVCVKKGVWKCLHCDYKDRKNKVVKHLAKEHKLQVNLE